MGFSVESRLGRGRTVETFAAVLEVQGERLDVVVKRARPEFSKNEAFQNALLTWGNAQTAADHDNLVAVLEAGRTAEGVYVIQERVDGAPLSTVLAMLRRRKRTLKPAFALLVADQVARALAYLHRDLGVGHGGLDPGEVMLSYSGGVKLGDQKLRELDHHIGRDLLEAEPSPTHWAPEQADGAPPTPRVDLYAYALLVLEMLIGHPVWTAESMTVDGALDALRDFSPLGQAQPELTARLVELLRPCLETRPDKRPLNAVPVAAAIAEITAEHGATVEDSGLGKFVEALVPPPDAEEAPTRMFDPAAAEELARKQEARLAELEGASVAIDPVIETRAAAGFAGLPKVLPPPAPPEAPPRSPSVAPVAPSRQVPLAVPNLARVAVAASEKRDAEHGRWLRLAVAGLVGVVIVGVLMVMLVGGGERTVRLRATSVPSGATVYLDNDGRLLGQTPVEMDVKVEDELLELRFELDGHVSHRITIGGENEIRYEARLSADGD